MAQVGQNSYRLTWVTFVFKIPKNLKNDYSSYIRDLIGEDGGITNENEIKIEPEDPKTDTTKIN